MSSVWSDRDHSKVSICETGALLASKKRQQKSVLIPVISTSRRDFLKFAALLSGATGISGFVPSSIQRCDSPNCHPTAEGTCVLNSQADSRPQLGVLGDHG